MCHKQPMGRQGLVHRCGFKEESVEWVYSGIGPLLLRDVLASRKGVAASLSLLSSCVARRLCLPLLPMPPSHAAVAGEVWVTVNTRTPWAEY